ncbi:hypothetical protein C8R45DRAFT_570815 [Mycena sanguinolenta]|nr:hypothetical protein C8R45DRAFT_570815 [Mycena sanguinolenta]
MKLGSPGVAFATCGAFFLQVLAQSSGPTDTASASQSQATLPVGSCTSTIPCSNSACCNGATGYCGHVSLVFDCHPMPYLLCFHADTGRNIVLQSRKEVLARQIVMPRLSAAQTRLQARKIAH